jgi:RNA polymerase sigma factor (sigma-70 family)
VTGEVIPNLGHEFAWSNDWVEAQSDYLFNFAVGQVRDPSIAEDLVQETFLAVLKSKSLFLGKSAERTWLVGILRHKIHDYLRCRCRERAVRVDPIPMNEDPPWEETILWLHDVAAECQSPSRRMELDEFRESLKAALGKLSPRIAQVFQLYAVEELPNREVCAQMEISESNLWAMLHRGRKQLRGLLTAWKGV